jgi:hypothetical protein
MQDKRQHPGRERRDLLDSAHPSARSQVRAAILASENVLGGVAAKHEFLQHPLIASVDFVNPFVVVAFVASGTSVHFTLTSSLALHALEHHDVVLLLHHVSTTYSPAGNRTVPTRTGATNVTLFTS